MLAGRTLWLVGAGNMGGAMLRGWIAAGLDPACVTVITRRPRDDLPAGVRGLTAVPDGQPDMLVLAMKPQQLDEVAAGRLGRLAVGTLVSVLAGVDGPALARRFAAWRIVRLMPNLPVAIGQGVNLLWTDSPDPDARADAEALARPLGSAEWIANPALFDAATALAGCGPGFVFRFIDALAAGGAALGLSRDQAERLARATVAGAAAMAAASAETPATLADRVASPGGSTREGLNVLDADDALARLLATTLAASEARNRAMAEAAR